MIIYRLMHLGIVPVQVFMDVNSPDETAPLQYAGSANGVQWVKDWIPRQYGIFGHIIGGSTTAIDLSAALSTPQAKKEFDPQLIQGSKVLEQWNPIKFKQGVCS